jgi:hypothetical protein
MWSRPFRSRSSKAGAGEVIEQKKRRRRAGALTHSGPEARAHHITFPRLTRKSTTFFIQDQSESCCSGRVVKTK